MNFVVIGVEKVLTIRGFIPGLKPKEKGRNSDFSKEFYLRLKQQEYEKAKTSILQKLRESQAIVDQRKEQQSPNLNRNNIRPER